MPKIKTKDVFNVPTIGDGTSEDHIREMELRMAGVLREFIVPQFAAIQGALDEVTKRVDKLEAKNKMSITLTIKDMKELINAVVGSK